MGEIERFGLRWCGHVHITEKKIERQCRARHRLEGAEGEDLKDRSKWQRLVDFRPTL